jgi:nucleotide-binding universal stress UspA family protein
MKLFIAYDGSVCSDAALLDLRLAGLPHEAEAEVVTVAEAWLTPAMATLLEPSGESPHDADLDAGLAQASRAATQLRLAFPRWTVRPVALRGSPAGMVLARAEEWKPDLVVVGASGASALERLVFGSVAHKVVSEALCSVRVARGHIGDHERAARIAIGIDGSPDSREAVRAVARRVWPAGTEVLLMTFFDPGPRTETYVAAEMLRVDELQSEAAATLAEVGIPTSRVSGAGDPRQMLVTHAEKWGADCIFVGSRGHGRVKRFVLGSVAAAVAARAPCSVEVTRPPAASDA